MIDYINNQNLAREEILEECGYDVPLDKIHLIKKYVTGISLSGTSQHLYYAMIDDSMKVNEGGGNSSEGEYIEKVDTVILISN